MTKLFTTLLIALGTTLFAQDQVAKDVLDRLSETTKSYKNMTVSFDFGIVLFVIVTQPSVTVKYVLSSATMPFSACVMPVASALV